MKGKLSVGTNLLKILLAAMSVALCCAFGQVDFHPPQPYDIETLYQDAKRACPHGELACLQPQFQSVTDKHGPRAAIELFTLLQTRGIVAASVDGHHVVHHAGHETAMAFGPTAQALALCPDSYNYGCMHGFFQHALGMGEITGQSAARICEDLQGLAVSPKAVQSCYHGIGHGVMMNSDYDLHKALGICDQLKWPIYQQTCWQGVFMENVDAAIAGQWQKGGFSREDPLAPCDTVDEKYQYQCFINHSAWMMNFYKDDLAASAQACLKASPASVEPCLQSLGLLTTNFAWQGRLLHKNAEKATFLGDAWGLCKKFPEAEVGECVVAAVDNLLNSGVSDVEQGQDFCALVAEVYRDRCSRKIRDDLRYLTPQSRAQSGSSTGAPE